MDEFKRFLSVPLAGAAVVLLAAMTVDDPEFGSASATGGAFEAACPAEGLQALIGQPIGEVDLQSLPRPFDVHQDGRTPREISEGGSQTNIRFSAQGRVTAVSCG